MTEATAIARSNIALTKYWGKSDAARNLPAVPSLSLTLAGLETRTRVRLDPTLAADSVVLDGRPAEAADAERVSAFLELVRARAGIATRADVESASNFPAGAGLASSASAFAALAAASARAMGLVLDPPALSDLARRGSASAARSVFGGFVELPAGTKEPLPARALDVVGWMGPGSVRMVVVRCGEGRKAVGSRDAMIRTARTSPFYRAWVASANDVHARALDALRMRDLPALGECMELSCLRMHASAMAADPAIVYWTPATIEAMSAVRSLRDSGVGAWFTIDAGPHVKVLCLEADAARVAERFGDRATVHGPGGGVEVVG